MPKTYYSYRFRKSVPLLSEEEFEVIDQYLNAYIRGIQDYRKLHNCSLDEARQNETNGQKALLTYERMTGERLEHPLELYSVRLSLYGSLCPECAKPFRTPRAKLCAECGYTLPDGQVAGPLDCSS